MLVFFPLLAMIIVDEITQGAMIRTPGINVRLKSYMLHIPNIKCVKNNIMCGIDNRG